MVKDLRWKWVDDLKFLEIINLLSIGISCYNIKLQVPNEQMNINKDFIPSSNHETSKYLQDINDWTRKKKMLLNKNKTSDMIFNVTEKYKFSTRLDIEGENIKILDKTKLLGTTITNTLKLDENTKGIIKKQIQKCVCKGKLQVLNHPEMISNLFISNMFRVFLNNLVWFGTAAVNKKIPQILKEFRKNL